MNMKSSDALFLHQLFCPILSEAGPVVGSKLKQDEAIRSSPSSLLTKIPGEGQLGDANKIESDALRSGLDLQGFSEIQLIHELGCISETAYKTA